MFTKIADFFLNFIWGKLTNELIPKLFAWLKSLVKRKEIKSEVDNEEEEIGKILKEINEYILKTGESRAPQDLEDKLNDALRKRNRGLSDSL